MSDFDRRKFLKKTSAAASVAAAPMLWPASAQAQTLAFKPEKDAKLRVLRWSRFVQGDIDAYMINVKRFTEKTGIEVRVDSEGWEDVRPKAAVAANIKRLTWKLHAIAIVSTLILVAGGVMLIWQQTQLYQQARERAIAAAVDAEIAEAYRQANVTSCGGRPCVKLDAKARRWGQKGDYVLLDLTAGKNDQDNKR